MPIRLENLVTEHFTVHDLGITSWRPVSPFCCWEEVLLKILLLFIFSCVHYSSQWLLPKNKKEKKESEGYQQNLWWSGRTEHKEYY